MVVVSTLYSPNICGVIKLDQFKLFWLTGSRSVNNRVCLSGEGGGGGLGMIALR